LASRSPARRAPAALHRLREIENEETEMSSKRAPHVLAAVIAAALASACIVGGTSHVETTGRPIGDATIEQIQPGKSREYVLALLGEPATKVALDGGVEIWKWSYTEKKTGSATVIFLVSTSKSATSTRTVYVEFQDGVVSKAWRD
jgi:outer membrane protein assembly factor BamE (lipoprotein component of BamABCDE complex)